MAHFPPEREIVRQQITNSLAAIRGTIFRLARPIEGWETAVAGTEQDVAPPPETGWQPYTPGTEWGGPDITNWFRAKVRIPDEMAGLPVYAILNTGGEGLLYLDGEPHQGLDNNRWPVLLSQSATAGREYSIVIDAYANKTAQRFVSPRLCVRDELVWEFYWDLKVAFEIAAEQPAESHPQMQILDLVDHATKAIDLNAVHDIDIYHEQIAAAQKTFHDAFAKFRNSSGSGALSLMSHSHIDVAWQWRLRETRRKVGRTFSTVLHYMDQYPEVTFLQSQPQLYEYLKDNYPTLWERVKERVKEGRWEVNGAGWVEQDMNMPAGESHVRQYLYGNRFYRREFGIHARTVWMPDCFGFPYSLPQIMRKAQVDTFSTWKLIFNEYQQHPYCFFRWKGLDGTEIPAVSLPTLCGGDPNPHEVKRHWDAFRQKDLTDEFLFVFGHGDGGGGPTTEMFEYVRREDNVVGIPRCTFGSWQKDVDKLCETVEWDRVPVFNGELYFEEHRGCQTSQANTKKNNRKSELLARDTELFASLAHRLGAEYQSSRIYDAWKLILLNQFHDILPGSSIAEVYADAEQDYATVRTTLTDVRDAALDIIIGAIDTEGIGTPVVVFNTLGWTRTDVATVNAADLPGSPMSVVDAHGNAVPSQITENAEGDRVLLFEATNVPSMGHAVYRVVNEAARVVDGPVAEDAALENDFFRIEFAENGTIATLYDKANQRDVLADGASGNNLTLFDDRPANYDAWDIDFNINEVRIAVDDIVSIEPVESGPVRATVCVVKKTEKSTITQRISLWRSIPRIDFATHVDWHEKYRLLKAAFPVDVLSHRATYEIQYGAIERPTHWSTSQDRARFEVAGHRWIDLSETAYGVSLLNDCKYGFDIHDDVMRISLLRSTTNPDPHADEGEHQFIYSLYPHAGSWQEAGTVHRAHELNAPLVARRAGNHTGSIAQTSSFVRVDAPNVVLDAVKKAEDSDAVIVRLYESHGARGPAVVTFDSAPTSVTECDLMEENDAPVACDGASVRLDMKPWEIRVLKALF